MLSLGRRREMIVRKLWREKKKGGLVTVYYDGLYLFGFIPLYVEKVIA